MIVTVKDVKDTAVTTAVIAEDSSWCLFEFVTHIWIGYDKIELGLWWDRMRIQ